MTIINNFGTLKATRIAMTTSFVRLVEAHCEAFELAPTEYEQLLELGNRHNGRLWLSYREGRRTMELDKLRRKIQLALERAMLSTETANQLYFTLEARGSRRL